MSLSQKLTITRNYDRYYKRLKLWGQQPSVRVSGLASLTIFTVAFFLLVAILPTFKTIAALNKEIDDQKTVNAKLTEKIASLQAAEPNYNTIIGSLETIKRVLPESENYDRLAWQIYWLAQQTGVEIISGNLGEFNLLNQSTPDGKPAELVIDLAVSGNYQQIKNFISRIIKIDRLITITDLSLSNKNSKISSKLTATLKLIGFYLPPEGEGK